jgi:DNA transformation protein
MLGRRLSTTGSETGFGLGPKSLQILAELGIHSVEDLRSKDVYCVYAQAKAASPTVSLNFLYGLISVVEQVHWLEVKRTRRTEILMRLHDMGLAPK